MVKFYDKFKNSLGSVGAGADKERTSDDSDICRANGSKVNTAKGSDSVINISYKAKEDVNTKVASISEWLNPGLQKGDSLSEIGQVMGLVNNDHAGLDLTGTLLNDKLARRRPTTLFMTKTVFIGWDGEYQEYAETKEIPFNRLTRSVSNITDYRYTYMEIKTKEGFTLNARVQKPYIRLEGDPILYMDFIEDNPKDRKQHRAHLQCVKSLKKGVLLNGKRYRYVVSSASQLRTLKGVLVEENYVLPESMLSKFKLEDRMDFADVGEMIEYNKQKLLAEVYIRFLRTLKGPEAILETMTYGAYSHHFSNRFAKFAKENGYKHIKSDNAKGSLAKFMARVGMALTSSIPFGKNWNVLKIGKVNFVWTEEIENMLAGLKHEVDGQIERLYPDEEIARFKKAWKADKLDGQNLLRASKVISVFKELYGIEMKYKDVVGKLIQYRWAGVKGTGLVLHDRILDNCLDPNGDQVYAGYDMIVEDNSWKYSPVTEFYRGELAPEFELVSISKAKFSANLNYQFIQAFDGDPRYPEETVKVFKEIIDENVQVLKDAMNDPAVAKAKLGMVEQSVSMLDELDIDGHEMTLKSRLTQLLAEADEDFMVVKDPYWRKKFLEMFLKAKEEIELGKIEVEGATRFVISDPIAMLRTDLMDSDMNINITSPNQVALRFTNHAYWADKKTECVVLRSPCVHPGEPQREELVGLDSIPEIIPANGFDIPARHIYSSINDLVILNGFSNALESLGGADTDGDKVLCITDQRIVNLRDRLRPTVFADIDSIPVLEEVNYENIVGYMADSLKNNGIGLITNYATTWRTIQQDCLYAMANGGSLSEVVIKALDKIKSEAIKNSSISYDWVEKDDTISAIANLNIGDIEDVYYTADLALKKLRELQEMAIDTAKSGVWVEFGTKDKSKNNYNHLALECRAEWHKPTHNKKWRSNSTMGFVSRYAKEKWQELSEYAVTTSEPLFPGANASFPAEEVQEVEKIVRKYRAEYGKAVNVLSLQLRHNRITEDTFNAKFDDLVNKYHLYLTTLAIDYGVDMVAIAAYDASYEDAKKNGRGASFVWSCFFEEFRNTVKYYRAQQEDSINERLYAVNIKPELSYLEFLSSEVEIKEGKVYLPNNICIGACALDNGEYDMVAVEGRPYIIKNTMPESLDELTTSLAGETIKIIGTKYYEDVLTGENLTKEIALDYLSNEWGDFKLTTEPRVLPAFGSTPRVLCEIRVGEDENGEPVFMTIGSLEFKEKAVNRALSNKGFQVRLHERELDGTAPESAIMLVIEEVIWDANC